MPTLILAAGVSLCVFAGLLVSCFQRYRAFRRAYFDDAPIPMLIEDWSGVRSFLAALRAKGVTDVVAHLQAHPDLVRDHRRYHRFVDANDAVLRLLGARDKVHFQEIAPQLLPANREIITRVYQALLDGKVSAQGERLLHTIDGRVVPVIWRATLPSSGDARRILFYAFDVSDQKRAQEMVLNARGDLAHAARVSTVGELSASIAHDVAQPIAAIAASAVAAEQWLLRAEPSTDRALNALYQIRRNAQRASDVVGRIKTFLRKAPKRTTTSADALVKDALALIDSEAHLYDVTIRTLIEADLPAVRVDEVEIKQVILNLALNAMQAMAQAQMSERVVTVAVCDKERDGGVEVQIRDNGPGMSEETLSRIFEPFFSTKEDGMGLGLVICKSIINSHGGDLSVVSVEKLGTIFRFILPYDRQMFR
ncbi:two-component system sensor histidine kinase NtrB [Nitrospirillum pindoramense]|uniref:two-component system sensor histidine kinase NtrB n=1 Tax=Nitrospirillum amazonense TaxID=28077 RepID=UPI001647C0B2|nr:ATP-binding protein [Nitrospirillum amazonense]